MSVLAPIAERFPHRFENLELFLSIRILIRGRLEKYFYAIRATLSASQNEFIAAENYG